MLDIFGFTETKLTDDIKSLYEIIGYQQFALNNKRNSGGVAIYVKNNLSNIKVRSDLSRKTDHLECLFLECTIDSYTFLCGVLYRRPNSNMNSYFEDLNNILDIISGESKISISMGDNNLNLLNMSNNINVNNLVNLFHSYNYFDLINKPTRVTSNSTTLIDHIWSNNYANSVLNGILYTNIADHFPVFSIFNLNVNKPQNSQYIYYKVRELSRTNIENFKDALNNTDWGLVISSNDANVCYNNFITLFSSLFNRYCPVVDKKVKTKHVQKPFITPEILLLMKERDKLQKKYSKHPITYSTQYKSIRNRINNLIRQSKAIYYKSRLTAASGNSRDTWNVLNKVLRPNSNHNVNDKFVIENELSTDAKKIVEGFNNYYVNAGVQLSNNIPNVNGSHLDYLDFGDIEPLIFEEKTEN